LALKRLDFLGSLEVFAEHGGAGHHVVLKNGVQLLDVLRLQQTVQSGLGELGEGLVGRGEHGEGALGLQSSDQFAFGEGSDEG